MTGEETERRARKDPLEGIRSRPWLRRGLTVLGIPVGLGVAQVHWSGFVLGGALVALPQETIRRGLVYALWFSALSLVVFLATLAMAGVLDTYRLMGPVLVVSVLTPLLGGTLGGLVRGVV